MGLGNRAMLVHLHKGKFGTQKTDKIVSDEVNREKKAKRRASRVVKNLFLSEDMANLNSVYSQASIFHKFNTCPWEGDSVGLLPSKHFYSFTKEAKELQHRLHKEKIAFSVRLEENKLRAKANLGEMYNEADYPSSQEILDSCFLDFQISPIPDANNFVVEGLMDDEVAEIKEAIANQTEAALAESMKGVWQRLYDVVKRMVTELKDPEKKIGGKSSLISGVVDLCNVLPNLNLNDDVELEQMRRRIKDELTVYDKKLLNDSAEARKETADAAQGILDSMAGYMS